MRQSLILFALGLICANALPASAFEGTLTWRQFRVSPPVLAEVVGDKKSDPEAVFAVDLERWTKVGVTPSEMKIRMKGSMVRMDMPGGAQDDYVVVDNAKKTISVVLRAKRQLIRLDANQPVAPTKPNQEEMVATLPEPKDLKQSKSVNGEKASVYEVVLPAEVSHGWVTQAHPELLSALNTFHDIMDSLSKAHRKTALNLFAKKGLPVRVQTLKGGNLTVADLTSVRTEKVPSDIFAIDPKLQQVSVQDAVREMVRGLKATQTNVSATPKVK